MKTKFYTGAGDGGTSKLGKCELRKDDVFFEVLGGVDELSAWLGLCRVEADKIDKRIKMLDRVECSLKTVQEHLFVVQAQIASLGMGLKPKVKISKKHTKYLETEIKKIDETIPAIKAFIIPGGNELIARLDVARTLARKLERMWVTFSKKKKIDSDAVQYINRLSSFLFALARLVQYRSKIKMEHPKYPQ
ncbi:MAG: cob(I)yrinic acid a,c-diamide adenosyltransferase [Parcubacteria group bacterium]